MFLGLFTCHGHESTGLGGPLHERAIEAFQRAVPRFFASDIGQLVCVYLGQLPPVDPATGGLAPKVSTSRLYACTHRVTQEFEVYAQKLRCAAQIYRHNRRSPRIVCA